MDLKKLEPEERLEEVHRTLKSLSQQLKIVVKFFDLMSKSPNMVTRTMLVQAKDKVSKILAKAKETEKALRKEGSIEDKPMDSGSMHPVMILDEVSRAFEQHIDTQLALYADEVSTLNISDRDFEYVLRTLYSSAVRTQRNMRSRSCEVSVSASGKNMILKFTDFGKVIPQEHIESLFDGSAASQEYGGGYPFYRMKRLLERAQGGVEVLCEKSKYTTFLIKIPFSRAS